MGERTITPQSIRVGPYLVNVVCDNAGFSILYLDVGGTSYLVLGIGPTPDCLIVDSTTASRRKFHPSAEVFPNHLQYGEQFRIYGIESATASTGELMPAEIG